jgi:hypothetical protein
MATPEPVPPLTLAQVLDALDAHAKAKESKVMVWLKANWHSLVGHLGTWSMVSGAASWVMKHL